MTNPLTFAITGASGQLGRLAAEDLLDRVGDDDRVVLLTRNPDALADLAARGAELRAADFDDPAGLPEAFAGVDRLLLVSTDAVGSRVEGHRAAISAAAAAGVSRIAYTSVPSPTETNPALVVADHATTEAALRESGVAWVALRNNLYAEMQAPTIEQAAATGTLVTNTGDGGAAYVTRADCAAAAVGALLADDEVNDSALNVTGPTAVTAADLAALASARRGSEVAVVQVDDDAYRAGLIEQAGLPEPVADLLVSFGAAIRDGWLDEVTDTVPRLGGRPATALGEL